MLGLKQTTIGKVRNLPDETKVYIVTEEVDTVLKETYMYYAAILCIMLNVDLKEILGKSRRQNVVLIRTMVWLYMREKDGISTKRIAMVSNRNYSTVIVLSNNLKDMFQFDKKTKRIYDVFRNYADNQEPLEYVKGYEWD
jgi:chromosomal replication initiation ATPase DnaA